MNTSTWIGHDLAYPQSFEIRRPVLEAFPQIKWRLEASGKGLEFERELTYYSAHERDIIEFALNPYYTAKNIFSGLDSKVTRALAEAIFKLFAPHGALDRPESNP